ncbi:hypothetical protein [Pseudochrobactrum saccharolyticum]|uniref:hypothetical protein n=1 Tax=Pseudochrobactrum saccharolyticum TaxID=354352 RepID=UPI002755B4E0|nr:hypothetical protein [Pseudochrobactrum saccharolyticum]MDP8249595.1 hypothetical protein [Pseudochrobactrum saccharolyticum]
MNFAVVLLGAAAFSDILKGLSISQHWIGAAVATIAAAQLAFDFGGMARTHQQLQRDYYNLLADIEAASKPNERQCAQWYASMVRITGDEPPTLRAIDAKAYNDAHASMELPADERLVIPIRHMIFKNWCSFEGYTYQKISEIIR